MSVHARLAPVSHARLMPVSCPTADRSSPTTKYGPCSPPANPAIAAIEALGLQPKLVMGDSANLKVTYAPDLKLARMLLSEEQ